MKPIEVANKNSILVLCRAEFKVQVSSCNDLSDSLFLQIVYFDRLVISVYVMCRVTVQMSVSNECIWQAIDS